MKMIKLALLVVIILLLVSAFCSCPHSPPTTTPPTTTLLPSYPDNFTQLDEGHFYVSSIYLIYEEAELFCQKINTTVHLATLNTQQVSTCVLF